MAEGTLYSLSSKLLSRISSPAFVMAYESVCSRKDARDDLRELERIIETIRAVLPDAERKQYSVAAIRGWIKRIGDVLYEAHDLFLDLASNGSIEQQIKGDKPVNKALISGKLLWPINPRNSIAKRVKAVRESLLYLSKDLEAFAFVPCHLDETISGIRKGHDLGCFVDFRDVIGRDEDKRVVLEVLLHDQSDYVEQNLPVIAIVGVGGIGKTTLAQLVYNDDVVQDAFEERWFAFISDTSTEREFVGKIFESMCEKNCDEFTFYQISAFVKKSLMGKKFLLVLDDVWDENCHRAEARLHLLSGGAKGSMVIVTSRSLSVVRVYRAMYTHSLDGLSDDASWDLFQRVAFSSEQWQNPIWNDLGREIVKKCKNIPLAINSIGSTLYTKSSIQEWKSFKDQELSIVGGGSIMSLLKWKYDLLNSNVKQCFAYCSLFPFGYIISKWELIYLWTAQGYINESYGNGTVEELGHSYFMELLRNSFFQVEATCDITGEVITCKMHDIFCDLAQFVAREECILLNDPSRNLFSGTRHIGVGFATEYSWAIQETLLKANRLCSFLVMKGGSIRRWTLDQQFANFKFLHALSLKQLQIEYVPSYIGELKHLQYLDLSETEIINIPDSITNLLNLLTLDVHKCKKLEALPSGFRKLSNLRHLKISNCDSLDHMPPRFGELTSLQHLDEFKVGRAMSGLEKSKLNALSGLKLSGTLAICFKDGTDDWDGVVECWQPPVNLQGLSIHHYEGVRMPRWADRVPHNLTYLSLSNCSRVNCLPPFGHLPQLEHLSLVNLTGLEYIEDSGDDDEGKQDPKVGAGYNANFFPCLQKLELRELPKLKGWSRRVEQVQHSQLFLFHCLSTLHIDDCPELKFMPRCPRLGTMRLKSVNAMVIPQLLSICDFASSSTASSSSSSSSSFL